MFKNKFKLETQLSLEKIDKRLEVFNEVIGDTLKTFTKTLNSQTIQINTLINENKKLREDINVLTKITEGNLGEADQCEFLMLKTYRKDPVIFKDGKLVSTNDMTSSYVHWDKGEKINVEVNS